MTTTFLVKEAHMDNPEMFTLYDEDGNGAQFVELFNFDLDDGNQSYIVLRAADQSDAGDIELLPFRYDKNADAADALSEIETDTEFEMVEEVMNTILDAGQL